ncbi:MAG TPA: alpha/beta hydrolase [Actinomycetota bacterium]|nr:alpha/beta hydrolase [Actinomycetota bacterium]
MKARRSGRAFSAAADPAVARVLDAEARLFASYELEHTVDWIERKGSKGRIRTVEVGNGAPVVLLHGAGVFSAHWAPLIAHTDRRCIAIDLPGASLSDATPEPASDLRSAAVRDLVELLDVLELHDVPLIAASYGAMCALWTIAEDAASPPAVVVLGSPALAFPGVRLLRPAALAGLPGVGRVAPLVAPLHRNVTRALLTAAIGSRALRDKPRELIDATHALFRLPHYRRSMWRLLGSFVDRNGPSLALSNEDLAAIDVPVMFVWGTRDVYMKAAQGRVAVERMPNATLEIVDAGHAPWLDDPALCAARIDTFLRSEGC